MIDTVNAGCTIIAAVPPADAADGSDDRMFVAGYDEDTGRYWTWEASRAFAGMNWQFVWGHEWAGPNARGNALRDVASRAGVIPAEGS